MKSLDPIRPERTLMLVNPLSFRLSLPGAFAKLRKHAQTLGLNPHVVYGPQEIEPLLGPALDRGIDLIIIVGGDGTLQGTISLLATAFLDHKAPPILMLGGGRTNYTAAHLGTQRQAQSIIEQALTRPDQFTVTDKASLAIEQAGQVPIHGFFMGGALVDHIIRDCHQYRASGRGRIRQGRYSTVWRLIQLFGLALLGRVHYQSRTMTLSADGLGTMECPIRLLVATTLDASQVQVHPYLAKGDGPINITAIDRKAHSFWRLLPWLLRGKSHRHLSIPNGYFSGRVTEAQIEGLGQICVDGQEYDLDPQQTTVIRPGPVFRFLSL